MLSIGNLSRATGVKVPTIRYYERIGLMPQPARSTGNQRLFAPAAVARLAFIVHARGLGFGLEAIRDLLGLVDDPDRPCEAADAIARAQLAEVEARIARLEALRSELERMIADCAGGRIAECRVIEALSGDALWAADHAEGITPEPPPREQPSG